jgi:hypothetical protein
LPPFNPTLVAVTKPRGRIVKTTGDGLLVEFASVVAAVRCAVGTSTNPFTGEGCPNRVGFATISID